MSRSFCSCGSIRDGKEPCPGCGGGRKHHGAHVRTTAQRGYDHAWRLLSERVRAEQPLCVDCLDKGKARGVEHVHHIIPIHEAPHRRLDRSNVVPLCSACHRDREQSNTQGGRVISHPPFGHDRSAPTGPTLAAKSDFHGGENARR